MRCESGHDLCAANCRAAQCVRCCCSGGWLLFWQRKVVTANSMAAVASSLYVVSGSVAAFSK